MPTVPGYGPNQAAPSSNSGARFESTPIQDASGQQLQQFGTTLSRVGDDMVQQVNQVRVDDGLNKMRQQVLDLTYNPQSGYKTLKGDSALTRPEGVNLSDEYGQKLKTSMDEVAGSLGNDQQRIAFTQQANNLMTQFQSGIQQHTLEEYRSYSVSTQDGTIKLGMDEARLNWQDPDKIRTSLDSVKAAVYRLGSLQGWSANDTTARLKQTTSGVHMGVIDTAMQESNPEYAMGYMERYKDEMTADDLLKVRGVITKDVNQRMADGIATNVVGQARARSNPNDLERMASITIDSDKMTAITAKSESGNRERDAAGNLITSPKGAQGKMQVMPATNRDPGFGVAPAKDDSDAERSRVGREYLQALVKNYAGDPAKAWGAYNWGPGKVDAAIKEHGADWLAHAPEETRKYVAKNLAALGSGAGATKPTLQDVHDGVRAQVANQFGATPPAGVLKLALANATQQFQDLTAADKADEEQRVTDAMRVLQQNGGHFSRLPYAVRSQIPPDKVDSVLAFGQKIAKGDDITNPAVYQRLANPTVLTSLSDNQFFQLRGELSESDFKQLANQRATAMGKPGNTLESINMDAMNSSMRDTLASLQIDPSPKDGTPEAAQLGAVKLFVKDSILARQKATGKVMTDAETESHIKALYAKSVTFRSSVLGISTGETSERLLTMKVGDIPSTTREALERDFAAAGVATPSDADVLGAYLRLRQMQMKAPRKPDTRQSKSGTIKYNNPTEGMQ